MNQAQAALLIPKLLERVESLISVLEFHFQHSNTDLLGAASALANGDVEEASEHHGKFVEFAARFQGQNPHAATILAWAAKTQAGMETVLEWLEEPDDDHEGQGHDPAEIQTVHNANKWNHITLKSGKTYKGLEFFNDHWVGLHHPYNGTPLRDVTIEHLYAHDNLPWTSRAYEWQENIVLRHCTTVRNRREHFWYPNIVGLGRDISQKEANKRTAVLMENHYAEDCDAQWWQFVGINPKDTQRLSETGLPFEDAWSPAGRVIRKNMVGKRLGRGRDTGHPDRVGFTMSDFPYQSVLEFEDITLDNRGVKKGGGAWLVQGHPELHATNVVADLTGVDADKEHTKIEDCPVVVIKGGMLKGGSRKQFFLNRCKDVVIEGVDSDLSLYVDGQNRGPVSNGYKSL